MASNDSTSLSRDIYSHFGRFPTGKTFCLAAITGVVQALLLLCVGIDYMSKWSSRWLAVAAGSMVSDNRRLLLALALCKVASLAALLYYVHSEALSAVALLRLVTRRNPGCIGSNVNCALAHYSPFLVLVPLWQLSLAIGTLSLQSFILVGYYLPAGYGSYTINQDGALITEVIFAAVALSFVLDLDNKALEMLHNTPETFSVASMYSAVFAGSTKTADHLLPQATCRSDGSIKQRYTGLWSRSSLHLYRLTSWLNASRAAGLFGACMVCVFHTSVLFYTSFTLNLLVDFSFDSYPTLVPATSDIGRVVGLVTLAVVIFIVFQLVLGIWLPPPAASTAACETACSRAGRSYKMSQCRVSQWYAFAGNAILPLITAGVNWLCHHVANLEGHKVLRASGVQCDGFVNEQLALTGGANVSCGNVEVDMTQYVVNMVAKNSNTSGSMEAFPICNMLGVCDLFKCSFVWYVVLPVASWVVAAVLLVLLPLLVAVKRQQPCRTCARHETAVSNGCERQAPAAAEADSVFAAQPSGELEEWKSV